MSKAQVHIIPDYQILPSAPKISIVCVSGTPSQVSEFVKKRYGVKVVIDDKCVGSTSEYTNTFTKNKDIVALFHRDNLDINTIAHECVHIVTRLFEDIGVEGCDFTKDGDDELLAYPVGDLVENISDNLLCQKKN